MTDKKFVWLIERQHPRSGPVLEPGQEYDVAQFGEGRVSVWVKSGAAKYVHVKKGESLKEE